MMGFSGNPSAPALQGRCFMPGPAAGFYDVLAGNVQGVGAGGSATIYFPVSGPYRIVGFGWNAHGTTGSDLTLAFGHEVSVGGGATSLLSVASIDLDANPNGYIIDSSTSPASLVATAARELAQENERYLRIAVASAATGTVLRFSAHVVLWRTGHILPSRAED